RLTWNDEGNSIAVVEGKEVTKMREKDNTLVVFPNVRTPEAAKPVTLDASAAGFPKGFLVSERGAVTWSDDNKRVFFGMIPQTPAPDTARRKSADSVADVDIWRANEIGRAHV